MRDNFRMSDNYDITDLEPAPRVFDQCEKIQALLGEAHEVMSKVSGPPLPQENIALAESDNCIDRLDSEIGRILHDMQALLGQLHEMAKRF